MQSTSTLIATLLIIGICFLATFFFGYYIGYLACHDDEREDRKKNT